MSIYVICGEPGAGKSAFAYVHAGTHCRWDRRQVLATYDMDWYNCRTCNWVEMAQAKSAVCFVDESADLWHARNYNQKDQIADLQKFREHRKDGLTLYLIVQDFATLDTNIRAMVRYVWHVKRLLGPDFFENPTRMEKRYGIWSMARLWLAKSYLTESKKFSVRPPRFFRVDRTFNRFDTLAKSAGKTSTAKKSGTGLAPARRTRDEAEGLGAIRPAVVMPFSREEYLARTRIERIPALETASGLVLPASPVGRVRWDDSPFDPSQPVMVETPAPSQEVA